MNRTERFYKIEQILHHRHIVPLAVFLEELGISRATFNRDMEYLRDRLHAPIIWDREAGGYRFTDSENINTTYELPGLWFSAGELYALLAAQKLLTDIEPGILARHIAPLQTRLAGLLEAGGQPSAEIAERVRLLSMAKRTLQPRFFTEIATAVFNRQQLDIQAWNRGRNEINLRRISPQRLIHYRDNWYLDAWCHWRQALRNFSIDSLQAVSMVDEPAIEMTDKQLDEHFASAYGIFAGAIRDVAVLKFSPERARWVRSESWHPQQVGEELSDGSYRLTVPYADDRELLMDILRHGSHVEVEAPDSLRESVAIEAAKIGQIYQK